MALRALKTDEEIGSVPLDKPVLIELPAGVEIDDGKDEEDGKVEANKKPKKSEPQDDDGSKVLREQLEAAQSAQKRADERAAKAEREAAENRRLADQRAKEADEARKRSASLEGDIISGGLSAAQNELASAKAELVRAGEAGDYKAMGEAQSRIGRASAQILSLESGAAEAAEREKEFRPAQQEQVLQQPRTFEEHVRSNPGLLHAEREWMIKNKTSFDDPEFNKKLEFAYSGAMGKGLVRGSQDYFDHIERATGLKAAPAQDEERELNVQAPPSRNDRGTDGRVSNGKVMLTPEERDICKSMGISEIDYARQKVNFDAARKADPDKYR
ncbi:hypothetical protein IC762_12310 [Bradyrhizobium genosp. L]|uniref:hypothetical protein n=1 Tax=Bradyrhizobium genosp. L TaxID=83637 RepID=UPI0018A2501D|nr:hypothetical protein [Bradyrhizobium genosp. L]QPF87028.1 hypothetical protein IC762_12310 [Bradyrhizobium genosp. L]